MIGKTMGHYDITSQLGKGGMGEVYQATDRKLGREVAIKVLPEEFARDADRVARFQREAKLLASLNHPNIASIYGLEESGGTHFLVMELIEGQTLDTRINAGPIPVEESLKLALQIAEALEAAHEKGVIHRDLKPANIKVTPDGKIKVLDFGLAKAFAGEQSDLNLSNSPTLSQMATMQGMILGTAAYMSPEQARGKEVDKRADIWSFGVVLFEMLTGRQIFSEDTVSDTLASVLKTEPEWERLPRNLHPRIRLLLERCLEKDPKNRYSGISDARVDIQTVLADPAGVFLQTTGTTERQSKLRTVLPWGAAILFTIIVGVVIWNIRTPRQPEVISFDYDLPEGQHFGSVQERAIAISPDGSRFVYQTEEGLYIRSMAKTDAKLIRGTEGAQNPFFSPNGRWIGYITGANRELRKVPVDGGGSVPIANVDSIGFLSWGTDDAIVYAGGTGRKIMKVSAGGGDPEVLIETERDCYAAQILPDGKTVMYMAYGSSPKIVAQSIGSSEAIEVISGDTAQYLKSGHIVYAEDNNLYVVAFDPDKLEVTGSRALIVEGVLRAGGAPHYAVSDSGTLVYMPSANLSNQVRLEWYDRKGNPVGSVGEPGPYRQLALFRDGEKVIVEKQVSGNSTDLWMFDLNRAGSETPFVTSPFAEGDAVWSPNGDYIAYDSNSKGSSALYRKSMIVEEEDILLLEPKEGRSLYSEDWSRDGRTIAYLEASSEGDKIYRLPLLGEPTPEFIVGGPDNYDEPKFSPDGKMIAYVSNESRRDEIWIKPLEGGGRPVKVSSNGGGQPQWTDDGKELFFLALDGTLMAVDMGENPLAPGLPVQLFQTGIAVNSTIDQYAVTGDGRKFLILNQEGGNVSSINVVVNWFETLKDRAPAP